MFRTSLLSLSTTRLLTAFSGVKKLEIMLICGRNINPFSTVTYSFTNASEIARTILLILVRVYEGYKIKKDILHPFIPHTSFLKLYKIGK